MKRAIFNFSGDKNSDAHELLERSGQIVTVLRPLTEKEADLFETGPMYRIQFLDGTENDAFADELTPVQVSTNYCMLLSHPGVLPYFIRSELLYRRNFYEGYELSKELEAILGLPLKEFAVRVQDKDLPDVFYDEKEANLRAVAAVKTLAGFNGMFIPLAVKNPDEEEAAMASMWKCNAGLNLLDGSKIVFTLPLKHQPTLYACAGKYHEYGDIKDEVSEAIASIDVQLPESFPFHVCIGVLQGFFTTNNR